MSEERAQWDSSFGFMLAMIGSAVGLGNIWRFPNVLYANGGGSFMVPYVIAIFLLGISFVLVEYALGYRFKSSLSKIIYSIKPKLEPVAWLVLIVVFFILCYYVVVIGWDLIYFLLSFTKAWGSNPNMFFANTVLQSTDSIYGITQFAPWVLISVICVWSVIWFINQRELNSGIGLISRILLPLLFLIVIIIVAFSLTLPGASIGYSQIYTPNWASLLNLDVWLAAFGQIVFSLSLGMAIAITYSSYLPDGAKVTDNAFIVAFSNSGFEVFNAFGVFSILGFMTYTSGIPFNDLVTEGTGLAFIVFPQVFNEMGSLSYLISPLFFLCILFAGITSAIALVEPIASSISEKFDISRRKSASLVCGAGFLVSLIFTTRVGSMILGIADLFLNNYALLLVVFIECIIFGWIYKFDNLIETLNEYSTIKVGKTWKFIIKFILPISILVLWTHGIYTTIETTNFISRVIMIILAILIIVVPFIISKIPAKNKDFYKPIDKG